MKSRLLEAQGDSNSKYIDEIRESFKSERKDFTLQI